MIALTLGEIAKIVGGALRDADPATVVAGPVEFDTRRPVDGGLFVAFAGDHVDGHDFAADAYRAGALACVVTRPVAGPRIEVADALAALTALAAAVARRLDAVIVEITGSSGKTTTKDMAAQVLAHVGPTVAPPGSFNNELGFPYTVLRADASTRVLVLEASARGLGHIRQLTEIAAPAIGVVLNVGTAHIGEFGSREAIARAKGEIVEALPAGGTAVLNAGDDLVAPMASRTRARVLTFGAEADVNRRDVEVDDLGRAAFELGYAGEWQPVRLRQSGLHQVENALAAAGMALAVGIPLADVAAALTAAEPASRMRMEMHERADGLIVINDAYNANPASTRSALEALSVIGQRRGRRTVAVLGEMRELGSQAHAGHAEVGQAAAHLGTDVVVVVGEPAGGIVDGLRGVDAWAGEVIVTAGRDEALAWVRENVAPSDVVLVKASRGAALESVADGLLDDAEGDVSEP